MKGKESRKPVRIFAAFSPLLIVTSSAISPPLFFSLAGAPLPPSHSTHQMAFVCFAESRHPELEQPDVVLLTGARGPQQGQDLLGVLPPSAVHFGELEEHLDLAERQRPAL